MSHPTRSAPPGVTVRSEGQRQLISLGLSLATLTRALGGMVTRGAIHGWRAGTRSPGPRMRAALASAYGIPPVAWTQLPLASPPDQGAARSPSSSTSTSSTSTSPPEPVDLTDHATRSTLEHASALLRQIQRDRAHADLLPSDRVRLADSEAKALSLRARLERDQLWFEDRIVREHPAWLKVRREIVRVLVEYPDAARAVAEALARLEA